MARSDLLIALVRAGASGDKGSARHAAEAIIAEERAKQHNVLAERLVRAMNSNGGAAFSPKPFSELSHRGRDFITEIVPRRQLDDLVLTDLCRTAILQLIEEQQRADLLRSHSLEPRHRVLLVGPPGNGKTSLAEAVAEALGVPFFVIRYETLIGSYLGETASRLKRVFDYARTTPCVLFFDEFDAIGKERGDEHETGEIKRVVTSLLMQIDDLPSYTVVIGASNHSELLDRATWRRFQLRLLLPMPNENELTRYFERFAARLDQPLGHGPAGIARKLGRLSYAEAEEFCRDLLRRKILAMGEKSFKEIATEQLKLWTAKVRGAPL
jgi:SpoVK/Ycf46/Vps4 family AAA+-type ATPase